MAGAGDVEGSASSPALAASPPPSPRRGLRRFEVEASIAEDTPPTLLMQNEDSSMYREVGRSIARSAATAGA